MDHNIFIHSSVNGHLGCFHVLANVNSTAMNNGMHVFFQFWFPQGIRLRVGLLGHMVVLFLVFKEISILSSRIYLQVSNGETDIENRLTDRGRGEERVRCMERVTWKLTLPYVK